MRLDKFYQCSWLLPLAAVGLLGSLPAQANMIVSISPVSVAAGTNGAFFDVSIQNTGPIAQNIAAFALGLSVAGTAITFTGGNESTSLAYIFAGDSFDLINSFPYTTVPPPDGQTVEASDLSNSGSGNNMGLTTLGLGRITFNVAANAALGPVIVTVVPDCLTLNSCTSFSDSAGADVPFTVVNGTITVTAASAATPEPSTLLLALFALPAMALRRRRGMLS